MSGVAFFAAPAASRARLSSLLVLLVCCASFSASPPTYRGLRPFTQSTFYQPPHKAQHLPVFPSLDLAVPAQLDAALAARAFKKNIILFTFTASAGCAKSCTPLLKSWLGDAVAMVAQLNDVGFAHYIAVTGTPEGCTELHSVWQTHHGARPSCAVAVHPSMGHEEKNQIVRAGWTTRYWLITQCIERGLDVLMHDLDMVFHTDPYALFKSPPLSAAQLIVLPEGAMNGGLCYVQNASSKGAAAWVLRQVERRSVAVSTYEHEHRVNGVGWMNDQDVLQDAMRVAQHAGSSTDWRANYAAWKQGGHNDSEAASHPFWGVLHPQPTQSTPDFMWRTLGGERWDAPAAAAGCPFPPDSDACARWRAWLPLHFANQSIRSTVLHVPADEPERGEGRSELAIAAPTWLWAVGDVTQQGWSHGAHPMTAMTHMLFTELCWSDVFIGSHIGRLLAAGANGYVSTLWALGAEKAKPLLWLHEDAVEALSFASTNHSAAPLKNALRSLGLLAALTGRLPVMPFVPCDAPFIARVREGAPHDVGVSSNSYRPTLSGVADGRVVVSGPAHAPRCSVSDVGWDACWPWDHVAYAWDDAARRRRAGGADGAQRNASSPSNGDGDGATVLDAPPFDARGVVDVQAWAAAAAAAGGGDVVLRSLGPSAAAGHKLRFPPQEALTQTQREAVEALARDCSGLVCPPGYCGNGGRCAWQSGDCEAPP